MGTEIIRDTGNTEMPLPRRDSRRQESKPARRTAAAVRSAPEHYAETQRTDKDPLTQFMGWFSIGLGASELFWPDAVARTIGIDAERHRTLLRIYGLRELAAGLGILTRPKPTYWMWNRVLGDAIDLVSLGKAMRSPNNDKPRLTGATTAVLGATALDVVCSIALTRDKVPTTGHDEGSFMLPESVDGTQVLSAVITVNKPVSEAYEFWKNQGNPPPFMESLDSGAETVSDVPNESISWRSVRDGNTDQRGTVRFRAAPGNRGTEVEIEAEVQQKGGALGGKISKLVAAAPKTQLMNDLRRLKQLMEVGEIVKSDATAVQGMHPARPPKHSEMDTEATS
ncbi:MAG: cyclase/dehydrase [Gemmatimonadaceae bacterium]